MRPAFLSLASIATALLRPVLLRLVRVTVIPERGIDPALDPARPVCYALPQRQLTALVVLEDATRRLGLASPADALRVGAAHESRASFFLSRAGQPSPLRRAPHRHPPRLARLAAAVVRAVQAGEPQVDCQIVPVSILWGQAPRHDDSLLRLLFADTWIVPGFFRQMLRVVIHGRHTVIRFGPPLSLRDVVTELAGTSPRPAVPPADAAALQGRTLRRVARLLRNRYRTDRLQTIGPNLSHRQTVIGTLVRSPEVTAAIAAEAAARAIPLERAELKARRFAVEIAADFSYPTIRALNLVFTWVFERLYDAIEATRFEVIAPAAGPATIVYVPNHRSHVDYMILPYVLLQRRMQAPHVAAGANLDLPLVGPVLRRGGAFFLRRSFKGEALYAAVFERYLDAILARGFPIEYFIEGGRSRTGRMLPPKSGLLTMTVESHLRAPKRDIVFVPVYFGYERLVEAEAYRAELAGQGKRKETLGALVRSLKVLRERFGRVRVNVGEPLSLAAFLRATAATDLRARVDRLGRLLARRINDAVTIGPVNLIAVALGPVPSGALDERHLVALIDALKTLLVRQPYSPVQQLTRHDGRQVVDDGLARGLLVRLADPAGDIVRLAEQPPVRLGYFRDNVVHAWALFGLLAALVRDDGAVDHRTLLDRLGGLYPFAAAELFLSLPEADPWDNPARPGDGAAARAVLNRRAEAAVGILADLGFVRIDGDGVCAAEPGTFGALGLATLARLIDQPLRRYLIVVALLAAAGSGALGRDELAARSAALGQRIGLLGNLHLPEVLDPKLTGELVDALIESGWLVEADGRLTFDAALRTAARHARRLLSDETLLAIGAATLVRHPGDGPASAGRAEDGPAPAG